jgi:intracellular multiplication protein IcmL
MSHKLGMLTVLILAISLLSLLTLSYFSYALRSDGEFYVALPNGTDLPLKALSRPNVSNQALLNWATLAATATFTLDFVNLDKNLADLKDYFTKSGYDSFIAALQETNTLTTISDKKLVMSAVAIGPAVISAEAESADVHSWKVEVPITVSYLSVSEEEKRNKIVYLTITQVPTSEASKGIGIERYVALELGADIMG